jgi:TonB family protein
MNFGNCWSMPAAFRATGGFAMAATFLLTAQLGLAADDLGITRVGPANSTLARVEKQVLPSYPLSERERGLEGWVDLSFVVNPDGSVADPIVENSSGQEGFERAALRAAARTRYSPATVNGKPVEQCANRVRYVFAISGMPRGATRAFRLTFKEIRTLIDAGTRDQAEARIAENLKTGSLNLYETSRLLLLRYDLCRKQGDKTCQLASLERAITGGGDYLERALYRDVLEAMAALQVDAQLFGDALSSIEKRDKLKPHLEPEHPLRIAAGNIRDAVASDKELVFDGRVAFRSGCGTDRPNGQHQLMRREFSVIPQSGTVNEVEIRCDWRRSTDTITPEKAWKIPDSWGDCQIFVFGDNDATFKLVEYPLVASAAAP